MGIIIPVDPETSEFYEYQILDDLKFELCATFETESGDNQNAIPAIYYPKGQDYNWQHGVGTICFERTIDPDFFKPRLL